MDSPLLRVHYRAHDVSAEAREELMPIAVRGVGATAMATTVFNTDEAAARHYLSSLLERDQRPTVRGLTAPTRPELMPDLTFKEIRSSQLTNTRLVCFEQTSRSVPIFGAQANVELGTDRGLVGIEAELGAVEGVSPVATLSATDAIARIAAYTGVAADVIAAQQAPQLYFYRRGHADRWHLAYFVKNVPAAPTGFVAAARRGRGHGGPSPRTSHPLLNYLVDAHDGEILFYYSAAPRLVKCVGVDELGVSHAFHGSATAGEFELNDPLRKVRTYDLKLADDVGAGLPSSAVRSASADWKESNTAAISAHVNATRVHEFFNNVLFRNGVDDKGMELVSIINCTFSSEENPPEWHNAVWWENRMWYGQSRDGNGDLRSYSRYLDIIAHELTHGVTQFTASLVYQGESGALDESFSDIFGVLISNWYLVGPNSDVRSWSWEIGAGWGESGTPLRDLSNPARTGDPGHMSEFLVTTDDDGGVHTNSNIHNKAAYNVLTARDGQDVAVFTPQEVATLYYLTLMRLTPLADFKRVLQGLVDVAESYWQGFPADRDAKRKAILDSYGTVGIAL